MFKDKSYFVLLSVMYTLQSGKTAPMELESDN